MATISLGVLGLKKFLTASPDERIKALNREKEAGIISPEGYAKGVMDAEIFRIQLSPKAVPKEVTAGRRGVSAPPLDGSAITPGEPTISPEIQRKVPPPVTGVQQTPTSAPVDDNATRLAKVMATNTPGEEGMPAAQPVAQKPTAKKSQTLREALYEMPPEEFKDFVNNNKGIPGLGYSENQATGQIDRIIPSRRGETQPDLNEGQLKAMTGLINARTQQQTAATSEARLGVEGRRADQREARAERQAEMQGKRYDDMNTNEKAKIEFTATKFKQENDMSRAENIYKMAVLFGGKTRTTTEDPTTGLPTVTEEPNIAAGIKAWDEFSKKTRGEAAPQIDMNEPPPASAHKGRIIRGSDGTRLQSDGTNWNPVR